ncbi:MAG: hypothetical protein CMB80_19945 [Flammeovirgaceae bacterium]|nr:hypothetical protein [Flammeovirgaceae bacterium]
MKGRRLSEKHKKRISEANKGSNLSDEAKSKISEKNLGAGNGMYGRTHSEKSRKKMSKHQRNRKRRPLTQEEKKRISTKLKGRPRPKPISEEARHQVISMYSSGEYTKQQLADELGLKYNTVVGILRRR